MSARRRSGVLDEVAHLRQGLGSQQAASKRPPSFFDWAQLVPEPRSGTLDFERFPFQKELYERGASDREMAS